MQPNKGRRGRNQQRVLRKKVRRKKVLLNLKTVKRKKRRRNKLNLIEGVLK